MLARGFRKRARAGVIGSLRILPVVKLVGGVITIGRFMRGHRAPQWVVAR